jgi:hypothetical protein
MILLAVAAGDRIFARGDLELDTSHFCSSVAAPSSLLRREQAVDLRDRAFDLATQRLMHFAKLAKVAVVARSGHFFGGGFDARQSPLDTLDCSQGAFFTHDVRE